MFKLRIFQAEYGDSLIIEFGTVSDPRYILIDGGPAYIYERHLKGELQKIQNNGGKLDLMILSHVDNDHIIGLLDLMAELREQRDNRIQETISIKNLWHNSFSQSIDSGNNIAPRLNRLLSNLQPNSSMTLTDMTMKGISQGHQLRIAASLLKIPMNSGFTENLVSVNTAPGPITIDNLTIQLAGPTRKNLTELRNEWLEWVDKTANVIPVDDPYLAAMIDRSIPNISSIMFLATVETKTILFTGDGRGDHLLQGLKQAQLLNSNGKLHVDVLKIPHHGSDRNVTKKFFDTIHANIYVISANGRHGNPDERRHGSVRVHGIEGSSWEEVRM